MQLDLKNAILFFPMPYKNLRWWKGTFQQEKEIFGSATIQDKVYNLCLKISLYLISYKILLKHFLVYSTINRRVALKFEYQDCRMEKFGRTTSWSMPRGWKQFNFLLEQKFLANFTVQKSPFSQWEIKFIWAIPSRH